MEMKILFWFAIIYCARKFRSGWYEKRRMKVIDFLESAQKICTDYDEQHLTEISSGIKPSSYEWVFDKLPSFDSLIFSLRKLRLENWLTEKEMYELLH